MTKKRCQWAGTSNENYIHYHDHEWGVPVTDDRLLFEFLILEGAQAGLSWSTILNRRQGYIDAFEGFDPEKVAKFGKRKMNALLKDPGIIRNKLKVESAVKNAKAFLEVQKEFGSFANYQWSFVDNKPIQNAWKTIKQVPAQTKESEAFSKDLKKRGFNFVGPTIIYAHMQAVGMVNDHTVDCFRYKEVKKLGSKKF